MADRPDIYTDGFSVSAGPFGLTFTFTLSQPTGEPGPHEDPREIVARVRMNLALAQAMVETVNQVAAAAAQGTLRTQSTIKH